MDVQDAICEAEALLPGVPVDEGLDPRWQAIMAVGEHLTTNPEAVWTFIHRWGGHPQADLRAAIATVLLEHLLEHYFAEYFPRVEALALADPLFGDTFERCGQSGQAQEPVNAASFEALIKRLREPRTA